MFHPIRTIRNTVEAVQLTILNFQRLLLNLIASTDKLRIAVLENTATNTALLETAEQTLKAAKATQAACQYLSNCERHRREQAGIRTEFIQ